jgi:hypothetical protein
MKQVGIVLWVLLAVYSAFCIWLPGLRAVYWKGSDSKMGTMTYFGFTLFFWSPLLLILQIIPRQFEGLLYLLMLGAFLVVFIGYLVDMKKI